jgi:dual specificity MAP kinase phosphatase
MIKYRHVRLLPIPNTETIPGGWLENIYVQRNGKQLDLVMDYRAFHADCPRELLEKDGRPFERVCGWYYPRRLRFVGVTNLVQVGLYRDVRSITENHPARSLRGMFHWRTREGKVECILLSASDEPADLQFSPQGCVSEDRQMGDLTPIEIVRDWSPAPQLPVGQVPDPQRLHQRYGGDPVVVYLDGKKVTRRLYIGGLEIQPHTRPAVDAVLNLGEEPSIWFSGSLAPCDRWVKKGEGPQGMNLAEIQAEADFVIERLRTGQRVLVHCWAGMNRSATIVCAILIILEGVSAEDALRRVRETHPWARPDSHHWLMLRWLADK